MFSLTGCTLVSLKVGSGLLGYARVPLDSTTILSVHGVFGVLRYMRVQLNNTATLFITGGAGFTGYMLDVLLLMGLRVGALRWQHTPPRNA